MMQKRQHRIRFIHLLRGIAAFCVLLWHYFTLFWLKRDLIAEYIHAPLVPETLQTPFIVTLLNPFGIEAFSWGNYGVAVFFIISGFVMPLALQKHTVLPFFINRFFRIFPVYIVGFSLTLLVLWSGCLFYETSFPYELSEVVIHYIPGLRDLMGSRSIDGIVWTLEVELKFYLLCAALWKALKHGRLTVFAIPILIAALCLLGNSYLKAPSEQLSFLVSFIYALTFSGQFIIFIFIGVALNFHYRHRLSPLVTSALIAILFGLFLLVWSTSLNASMVERGWSYGAAIATFILCYCFPFLLPYNRVLNWLADISYPLYVIHGVAGYVILRLLLEVKFEPFLALICVTCLALGISWIIHLIIEYPILKRFRQ